MNMLTKIILSAILLLIIIYLVRKHEKPKKKIGKGLIYSTKPIYAQPNTKDNVDITNTPIGIFNNQHKKIEKLKGEILCVFKSKDSHYSPPDTLIMLLNNKGELNNEDDLMFYGTQTTTPWEYRGASSQVPTHPKYKIYGPMCGDDNAKLRHLWFYNNFDCCYIDLNTIDKSITEIRFIHTIYEANKLRDKDIHNENFQFIIFNNWPSDLDYNFNYQLMLNDQLSKIVVSDSIDNLVSKSANFVSASLIRNEENSWNYIPNWSRISSLEEYFNSL